MVFKWDKTKYCLSLFLCQGASSTNNKMMCKHNAQAIRYVPEVSTTQEQVPNTVAV